MNSPPPEARGGPGALATTQKKIHDPQSSVNAVIM